MQPIHKCHWMTHKTIRYLQQQQKKMRALLNFHSLFALFLSTCDFFPSSPRFVQKSIEQQVKSIDWTPSTTISNIKLQVIYCKQYVCQKVLHWAEFCRLNWSNGCGSIGKWQVCALCTASICVAWYVKRSLFDFHVHFAHELRFVCRLSKSVIRLQLFVLATMGWWVMMFAICFAFLLLSFFPFNISLSLYLSVSISFHFFTSFKCIHIIRKTSCTR